MSHEASDEASCCAICLCTPLGNPQPLHCGHAFCPWCLSQARKAQRQAKLAPSCPLCRADLSGDAAAQLPPPPICAGCNIGTLSFQSVGSEPGRFSCDVCQLDILDRDRWLRCNLCDWDACNACCARLGPVGVANAQRAHALATRKAESRRLWRRAVSAVVQAARRSAAAASSSRNCRPEEPTAADSDGAGAYNVYSLYERKQDEDAGEWPPERLRQYYQVAHRKSAKAGRVRLSQYVHERAL